MDWALIVCDFLSRLISCAFKYGKIGVNLMVLRCERLLKGVASRSPIGCETDGRSRISTQLESKFNYDLMVSFSMPSTLYIEVVLMEPSLAVFLSG